MALIPYTGSTDDLLTEDEYAAQNKPGIGRETKKALVRGTHNALSSIGGFGGALGQYYDVKPLQSAGESLAASESEKAQAVEPAAVPKYEQIGDTYRNEGIGAAARDTALFATNALAEQIPQVAGQIATAGVGRLLGGKKAVTPASLLFNEAQSVGSIYNTNKEETGISDGSTAINYGTPVAGLETLIERNPLGRVLGGIGKKVLGNTGETVRGKAAKEAAGIAGQTAKEAVTEYPQTAIEQAARQSLDPSYSLLTPEAESERRNAALAGAVGGAGAHVGSRIVEKGLDYLGGNQQGAAQQNPAPDSIDPNDPYAGMFDDPTDNQPPPDGGNPPAPTQPSAQPNAAAGPVTPAPAQPSVDPITDHVATQVQTAASVDPNNGILSKAVNTGAQTGAIEAVVAKNLADNPDQAQKIVQDAAFGQAVAQQGIDKLKSDLPGIVESLGLPIGSINTRELGEKYGISKDEADSALFDYSAGQRAPAVEPQLTKDQSITGLKNALDQVATAKHSAEVSAQTNEALRQEAELDQRRASVDARLSIPEFRTGLESMAKGAGWAQKGGEKILITSQDAIDNGRLETVGSAGRAKWVPNEPWYEGGMGSPEAIQTAVRKAINGEKLGDNQKRVISAMLDFAEKNVVESVVAANHRVDSYLNSIDYNAEQGVSVPDLAAFDDALRAAGYHFDYDPAQALNPEQKEIIAFAQDHTGDEDAAAAAILPEAAITKLQAAIQPAEETSNESANDQPQGRAGTESENASSTGSEPTQDQAGESGAEQEVAPEGKQAESLNELLGDDVASRFPRGALQGHGFLPLMRLYDLEKRAAYIKDDNNAYSRRYDLSYKNNTVEKMLYAHHNAEESMNRINAMLLSNNRTGATVGNLLHSWAEFEYSKRQIEKSKAKYPEQWKQYEERQKSIKELKVGDKVVPPSDVMSDYDSGVATIVRKGSKNWRLVIDKSGAESLYDIRTISPVSADAKVPELSLVAYTEADIAAKTQRENDAELAKQTADKNFADAASDAFTLGSQVGAVGEQKREVKPAGGDMFAPKVRTRGDVAKEAAAGEQEPKPAPEVKTEDDPIQKARDKAKAWAMSLIPSLKSYPPAVDDPNNKIWKREMALPAWLRGANVKNLWDTASVSSGRSETKLTWTIENTETAHKSLVIGLSAQQGNSKITVQYGELTSEDAQQQDSNPSSSPDIQRAEILPGTRSVAQRIVNAHENFAETLMDLGRIRSKEMALTLSHYYLKKKLAKLDSVGGRITVKNGAYLDAMFIAQTKVEMEASRFTKPKTDQGETETAAVAEATQDQPSATQESQDSPKPSREKIIQDLQDRAAQFGKEKIQDEARSTLAGMILGRQQGESVTSFLTRNPDLAVKREAILAWLGGETVQAATTKESLAVQTEEKDYETTIKIAADSAEKLRPQDVDRVLAAAYDQGEDQLAGVVRLIMNANPTLMPNIRDFFEEVGGFLADTTDKRIKSFVDIGIRRRNASDLKESIAEKYGDDLAGLQLEGSNERYAFFLPDASEPGRVRATYFDANGLSGHTTYDTYEKALSDVIQQGYKKESPDAMERVSKLDTFVAGNEWAHKLQDLNSGKITWEQFVSGKDAAPSAAASAPETKKTISKTPSVDRHNNVMSAVNAGKVSPEDFKASFNAVSDNADTIKAELATKTKAELLQAGGGWIRSRYASEAKPRIIDAIYRQMLGDYVLGSSMTYGMGKGAYEEAVRQQVEATDADSLAAYAAEIAKKNEESDSRRASAAAGIDNPQTVEDFRNIVRRNKAQGKTFTEARLMMNPDQRAEYDRLEAELTRDSRAARKRTAQTEVKTASQTTSGTIVEGMHTKNKTPMWIVQPSERVDTDSYRTLLVSARRMGGNYVNASQAKRWKTDPGFQFPDKENAEAFLKLLGGDASGAADVAAKARDAFDDDRSKSASERLNEMASRLDDRANEVLNADRKTNTNRRAAMAARAEGAARADKALAETMRNLAKAIDEGKAEFLDAVRQKTQVEMLEAMVKRAKDNEIRAKYPAYGDQIKHQGEQPTGETADHAEFPSFAAYRSDLASLARKMLEVEGTKKIGKQLMSVADDVSDAYIKFAKDNLDRVSQFGRGDNLADFSGREDAEKAIKRSGLVGKAIVLPIKRGQNRIVLSPSESINRGIWTGDGDKRITLSKDFGMELVDAIGRRGSRSNGLTVPWQLETAADRLKALDRIGIETPAEFRSALREFIALRQQAAEPDKIKEMERAMVGRRNDGLDFFPTPAGVADEMVAAADIQEGMRVLEPSAGMGHIAERIREAGSDPDVVEMSADRKELLEAKGFNVIGSNFMEIDAGEGYDRIIMNPPFSDRRDAEHVRHAYDLLKPGGRIVAIMGEGVFFGNDKKAQAFREWLESVGGTDEKLQEGTFLDPSLPVNTGVNARMVVIDKDGSSAVQPQQEKQTAEPAPAASEEREISESLAADYRDARQTSVIKGTGWMLHDDALNGRGRVVLVSANRPVLLHFEYEPTSGTDHLRARVRAEAWAMDNPDKFEAPQGELVSAPLINAQPASGDQAVEAARKELAKVRQEIDYAVPARYKGFEGNEKHAPKELREKLKLAREKLASAIQRSEDASGDLFDQPAAAGNQSATPKTDTKTSGPKIGDFGETIGGAKKMLYADAYVDSMDSAKKLDIADHPLSKTWPEPDYQKLLEGGSDAWAVAFAHAARDSVPTKPKKGWKLNGWVQKVEVLRSLAEEMLSPDSTKGDKAKAMLDSAKFASLKESFGNDVDLYMAVGHEKSLKGINLRSGSYSMYAGVKYDTLKTLWAVNMAGGSSLGNWGKDLVVADTKQEAIDKFKEYLASNTETEKPATKGTSFEIYSIRGEKENPFFIGKKINKDVARLKTGFADAKSARAYLAENKAELEDLLAKYKHIPNERNAENAPRVGSDHRQNGDVTPEQFHEAFGFRGVQFGNYVEGSRRQQDLNQAYDALMDLAGVLNIPAKALSLGGRLGLAFGARGSGGTNPAAAHYEPDQVVINLTKANGAGSLAHEWWHALDNYFAKNNGGKSTYLTETTVGGTGVRAEMRKAFEEITKTIALTGIKERSRILDKKRSSDYWTTGREMSARSFESYIIAKLHDQSASNDYLANVVNEVLYALEGAYPYPSAGELPQIRAVFDKFFQTVETKTDDDGKTILFSKQRADQTGSPAFKKWFGDSKVVDKNGEPLVVYHGTTSDFSRFDIRQFGQTDQGEYGKGFYFALDTQDAAWYAGTDDRTGDQIEGGRVIPAFISLQNPYIAKHGGFGNTLDTDALLANGHDGVIAKDANGKIVEVVAFRPEQIKSAIGNNGAFDPANPDIRYSQTAKPANGIDRATAEKVVADFLKKYSGAQKLDVKIFDDKLQAYGRDKLTRYGALNSTIKGAYSDGSIHVMLDAHNSADDLLTTLRHEAWAHYGLDLLPASEKKRVLLSISAAVKTSPELNALWKSRILKDYADDSTDVKLEEMLAAVAEKHGDLIDARAGEGRLASTVRKLFAILHDALSKIGLLGQRDGVDKLVDMLVANARSMRTGGGTGTGIGQLFNKSGRGSWYYSALKSAAQDMKQEKGTPEQMLAMLARVPGVKPAEIEATGLKEYLALQGKSVTRQQILDYLAGNGVQVQETVLGAGRKTENDKTLDDLERKLESQYGLTVDAGIDGDGEILDADGDVVDYEDLDAPAQRIIDQIASLHNDDSTRIDSGETKFGKWQLPGGKEYRELLLTLPDTAQSKWRVVENEDGEFDVLDSAGKVRFTGSERKDADEYMAEENTLAPDREGRVFKSSHYGQPNILAHVRFNERTDSEGKRVLFIEEIQSDWAQSGRKDGFNTTPAEKARHDELRKKWLDGNLTEAETAEFDKLSESGQYKNNGVPSAPFVTSTDAWVGLAMKRMIAYAAENGFDRIAWTNGEQQAERYALSKSIKEVYWDFDKHEGGKKVRLYFDKPNGSSFLDLVVDGNGVITKREKSRNLLDEGLGAIGSVVGKSLDNVIGKDLASKIMDENKGNLVGENMDFGGKGMKSFYDQIVPKVAKEVTKKMGGKLSVIDLRDEGKQKYKVLHWEDDYEMGEYDTKEEAERAAFVGVSNNPNKVVPIGGAQSQPGFDITPEMRDAVESGLPLFSRSNTLTEKQFQSQYVQHIDLAHRNDGKGEERAAIIQNEGFRRGNNVNAMPPYMGKSGNILSEKLAPKAGDIVYLAPKTAWIDGPNGVKIKEGWKPENREIIRVKEDRQSMYQAYLDAENTPRFRKSSSDEPTAGQQSSDLSTIPANQKLLSSLGDYLSGKATDFKPSMLGTVPLMYMRDFARNGMPAVGQYIDTVRRMGKARNVLVEKYDARAKDWFNWHIRNKEASKALADLMHATTIVGIDPSKPFELKQPLDKDGNMSPVDIARKSKYGRLKSIYDALPEHAQKIYSDVRDDYVGQRKLLDKAIIENIEKAGKFAVLRAEREYRRKMEAIEDDGLDGEERDSAVEEAERKLSSAKKAAAAGSFARVGILRSIFESNSVEEPYFPLARFGNYFAAVYDGKKPVDVRHFDSASEQLAFVKEMEATGKRVKYGLKSNRDDVNGAIDPRFVADIDEALAEIPDSEEIRDKIYQRYLETMPDMSLRKSFIHRKKTAGYSSDALRAYSSKMFHGAYQISRLQHTLELQDHIEQIEEQAKHSPNTNAGMALSNEMRLRHQWVMNPHNHKASQAATTAAFVYYLGVSPAQFFLNGMQTVMLGVPIIGSRHGMDKAGAEITKAFAEFAKSKGHVINSLAGDEKAAMQEFYDLGLIDRTATSDLAGIGENGSGYSAARTVVMEKIGFFFQKAEIMNREVTALAAYRLARQAGDTHEQAIDDAAKRTEKAHFNYTSENRARFMQGNWARVFLVFRQYNVNTLYRLIRDASDSFKGESPEIRKEARYQLGGIMGMYALMAGVTGVPLYGLAMMLGKSFDDEDEDFEEDFKQGTIDLLGPTLAKPLLYGIPGALANVDLSSRIGMGNLWFRDGDAQLEGKDAYWAFIQQALGAVPGIAANIAGGVGMMMDGHVERGLEAMAPAFLRGFMRGGRYLWEGEATTMGGDPIAEVGKLTSMLQGAGLTPLNVATQYEKNNSMRVRESNLEEKRSRLINDYKEAIKNKEGREDAEQGIKDFNKAYPLLAITRQGIIASSRMSARREANTEGGQYMAPKMRATLDK